MSAKTMKRLEAENTLANEILIAVQKSCLSDDAVKAVLSRLVEVIDEEA